MKEKTKKNTKATVSFVKKPFSQKKSFLKKIALPLGGMILTVFGGLFLLIPRFQRISRIFRDNQKLVEQRDDFLRKAQLIASLNEEVLRENAQLAVLALPKEKDISLILYGLNEPVRNNNFYTEQLEFSLGEVTSPSEGEVADKKEKEKTTAQKPIEQVPVKMSLVGPGEKFNSLLKDMEERLPLVVIKSLEGRYSEGKRIKVDLSLSFFLSSRRAVYNPERITIADLTLSSQEEELLLELNKLSKSDFMLNLLQTEGSIPALPAGRENPFVLTD